MADGRGLPREQYKRTYVLIPPGGDASLAALIMEQMWDAKRWTVGGSADDAGIGDLDVRQIIAISPGDWGGDLEAFFEEHYPGIAYWPLEYSSEYQLVGRLWGYGLKESGLELAYPVMHGTEREPYVTGEFGTWRTSYYHMGLDLRASWAAWGDEVLSATDGVVTKAGYYDNAGGFGWRVRVRTQAPDGRTAYIRYAHLVAGGIYVSVGDEVVTGQKLGRPDSTGASSADHLHVDVKVEGQYVDPALLMNWQQQTIPANFPLLGIHGRGGGDYLASQGVRGWCVDPVYMNEDYQALDYGDLADAGVQTMVNLRRGWSTDCGGRG
ncbi:MAG: peptidoglycan DD-metalloendopeptidase family protein, partial [Anaerolineae bacterium]|nr:peptidoglycan DD-metalloendopeptidase family protein [Anaerolineae bacterium]